MASLAKYETYRPTSIDWIGDVPMHWEMRRFRYCFGNGKGLSITKENLIETGIPCVSYGEIHSKYGFDVDPDRDELLCVEERYLETNQSSLLSSGDFVFADTSEDIDGSGNFSHLVGSHKIFAGYHTIVSRLRINAIPRYIAYYFDSIAYRTQIRRKVQGVKVYSITNKILKDTTLLLPDPDEQLSIANYLDVQTQKIDRLIANKKAQAEKLKELRQIEINDAVTKGLNPKAEMKDSGIDWLGKIPKHWEVKRLKNFTTKIGSGVTPKGGSEVYEDSGIPIFRSQNIHFDGLKLDDVAYINEQIHNSMNGSKVERNDVLLNITGASIGRCYYYDGSLGEANVNQHVCIIRTNKRLSHLFLYWCLSSDSGQSQIFMGQVGTSREGLTFQDIKNITFALPPVTEQLHVANFLLQRITTIDRVIKNNEAQIEQLQELRRIKIYEAVTGKIKVNAYAETTA